MFLPSLLLASLLNASNAWLTLSSSAVAIYGGYRFLKSKVFLPVKKYFGHLDYIFAQFSPNGGSSVLDKINRTHDAIQRVEFWQRVRLSHEKTCYFDADPSGRIVWTNKAFLRELGATEGEVSGLGYQNFVSKEDRARVSEEIFAGTNAGIDIKTTFRTPDGRCHACEMLIVRVGETVEGYAGVLVSSDEC